MRPIVLYCAVSAWLGVVAGIFVASLMTMAARDRNLVSKESRRS